MLKVFIRHSTVHPNALRDTRRSSIDQLSGPFLNPLGAPVEDLLCTYIVQSNFATMGTGHKVCELWSVYGGTSFCKHRPRHVLGGCPGSCSLLPRRPFTRDGSSVTPVHAANPFEVASLDRYKTACLQR